LQHVDNCHPDASAKDLQPTVLSHVGLFVRSSQNATSGHG
jgi:hypothetical protein